MIRKETTADSPIQDEDINHVVLLAVARKTPKEQRRGTIGDRCLAIGQELRCGVFVV